MSLPTAWELSFVDGFMGPLSTTFGLSDPKARFFVADYFTQVNKKIIYFEKVPFSSRLITFLFQYLKSPQLDFIFVNDSKLQLAYSSGFYSYQTLPVIHLFLFLFLFLINITSSSLHTILVG